MLFYEPKFPKYPALQALIDAVVNFQCSSTSRNSQNLARRKSVRWRVQRLSVLFYEPKFPKCVDYIVATLPDSPFSALLRAEIPKIELELRKVSSSYNFQCSSTSRNSQNAPDAIRRKRPANFQCSSTSRNSQNRDSAERPVCGTRTFSALLRAEIPKINKTAESSLEKVDFQCSSTSRNSQNSRLRTVSTERKLPFSALLRAEIPKITARLQTRIGI